jgi:hypothetical protein
VPAGDKIQLLQTMFNQLQKQIAKGKENIKPLNGNNMMRV